MTGLSYYEPGTNWIYGQPDGPPETLAATLQAAAARQNQALATAPGHVPPGFGGQPKDPIIGWTVQNAGQTQPFRPYTPTGKTPDWTADVNSIGAGRYDQNQVVRAGVVDSLNRGPIGSILFDGYSDSGDDNPNKPTTDVSGTIADLEY